MLHFPGPRSGPICLKDPQVKVYITMENHNFYPFLWINQVQKWAIFNSYVSLLEGIGFLDVFDMFDVSVLLEALNFPLHWMPLMPSFHAHLHGQVVNGHVQKDELKARGLCNILVALVYSRYAAFCHLPFDWWAMPAMLKFRGDLILRRSLLTTSLKDWTLRVLRGNFQGSIPAQYHVAMDLGQILRFRTPESLVNVHHSSA